MNKKFCRKSELKKKETKNFLWFIAPRLAEVAQKGRLGHTFNGDFMTISASYQLTTTNITTELVGA